jgi:hypothetical protein
MSNNRLNYLASGLGVVASLDLHVCGVAALLAMYEVCDIPDENIKNWKIATLCLMIPAAIRWAAANYALTGNIQKPSTKNYFRTLTKPSNIFWEFNNVFLSKNEKIIAAPLLFCGIAFDILLGVLGMGAIWGASQALGLREEESTLFSSLTKAGYCLSGLRYGLCYLNAFHKRNYTSLQRATAFHAFETGLCSLTDATYYFNNHELFSTKVGVSELDVVLLDAPPVRANLTVNQQAALYIGLVLNLVTRGCLEVLGGTAALWGITGAANMRGEDSIVDGAAVPIIGVILSCIIACKFFMTAFSKLTSSKYASQTIKAADEVVVSFDNPFMLFSDTFVNAASPDHSDPNARSCSQDLIGFEPYGGPEEDFSQRKSDIRKPLPHFNQPSYTPKEDESNGQSRTYSGDFGDYAGFKSSVI